MRCKTILFILTVALLIPACQGWNGNKKEQESNGTTTAAQSQTTTKKDTQASLQFTTFSTSQAKHVGDKEDQPKGEVKIDLTYPVGAGKLSLEQLNRLFTSTLPDGMNEGSSPKAAAQRFVKTYIDNYAAEMGALGKKAKRGNNAWMNYETTVSTRNLYNDKGFWGYAIDTYSFTGGAHGMKATSYNVIDLERGRLLSLKDLFAESDYPVINRMLCQQLAESLGTSVDRLAGEDYETENIIADDNFMISATGITWLFNPYDIAPYAKGTVTITLSYRAILGYLIDNSPLLRIASK